MVSHSIELLLPGEPAAVRLMNTIWADRFGVQDSLQGVGDLRAILAATGFAGSRARVDVTEVAAARRLRDALRRLAWSVTEDDRPRAATGLTERAATDEVNAALAAAPPAALARTRSGWDIRRTGAAPVAAALGALAREGAELIADPDEPLRACYAPGCVLYFVKNHPRREWCSPECGNRVRAARHYARVRSERRR